MQTYTIGNHLFMALSVVDATIEAVNKARELFRAGDERAAKALYDEALNLRRIEQGGWGARPTIPVSPVRTSTRFRRPRR